MKKLFIICAFFAFIPNAQAVTCSQYMPACTAYTKGLSIVRQMNPGVFDNAGIDYAGFDEDEFNALGLEEYIQWDSGNPDNVLLSGMAPIFVNSIKELDTLKFDKPAGTTGQYVRGDGSLASFPTIGRSFSYPSRTLNSCFQISSTKDADFHYSIDITAALVLGGGTATITSYTNSGCTTGAQALRDGQVSGIVAGGTTSIGLDGSLPAGRYAKITISTAGLGATAAIRAVQEEVLY